MLGLETRSSSPRRRGRARRARSGRTRRWRCSSALIEQPSNSNQTFSSLICINWWGPIRSHPRRSRSGSVRERKPRIRSPAVGPSRPEPVGPGDSAPRPPARVPRFLVGLLGSAEAAKYLTGYLQVARRDGRQRSRVNVEPGTPQPARIRHLPHWGWVNVGCGVRSARMELTRGRVPSWWDPQAPRRSARAVDVLGVAGGLLFLGQAVELE